MRKKGLDILFISSIILMVIISSCGTTKQRLKEINKGQLDSVSFNMPQKSAVPAEIQAQKFVQDTIIIKDAEGNETFLMKAIEDEETGEMVATEVLQAATVTARFQNLAERRGKVDLEFLVTVPAGMMHEKWQFRLYPDLFVLGDSTRLEPVLITGKAYREAQLRGYERYSKFLSRIIQDDMEFLNIYQFELFLQRNIPELFAFKTDSSFVSEAAFKSEYGLDEQEVVEHYINKARRKANNQLKRKRGKMQDKYIPAPIVTEGIRLDSVVTTNQGDIVYHYVQTIETRPKLKKATILLAGDIYEADKMIYHLPEMEPLVYYISSMSSFADESIVKYLTKVIERRAEANTAYKIDFEVAKSEIKPELGENAKEIARIKENLASLMQNEVFDLDSISINATASPEGSYDLNSRLAHSRSVSVTNYFTKYIKHYKDSLEREKGFSMVVGDDMDETIVAQEKMPDIRLTPRSTPENWEDLAEYIRRDTVMTDDQKNEYFDHHDKHKPDAREAKLKNYSWYPHMKKNIYPKLRTVKFNFFLHRKGMVKDTVHTTVVDSTYTKGVWALKDMDYDTAISMLAPYNDYNTAVAYIGKDRNLSALQILEPMEKTAPVNYLLGILYSRIGEVQKAVECYMLSVEQEPMYRHRGNLDPEISVLIKQYGLFKEEEEVIYW
ncbi:MAG: hypothetical protein IJB38_08975 [Bacteroidales bacterium]|nr:hypothetical protein [Bacteroidales bacterium]